jgi:(p)ppGpp synthase/HD superfamily hydrolase
MINEDLLNKAYMYASKMHEGQKRDSGKDYMWHITQVVNILKLVTNDPEIIAAAYLHDVLEDCPLITKDDLASEFGERVANLVWEVTKYGNNCFPNLKSRDAFLIKFADRLQNLSDMVGWTPKHMQNYMNKSVFWKKTVEAKKRK